MKKSIKSISLNKSFLTKLIINNNFKFLSVIKPGYLPYSVIKPVLKQKTDRGEQMVTLSKFKKLFLNSKIESNRLDLVLFNLKFSTSLRQSKFLIKQKLIKVNGKIITNANYLLSDYSIIECKNGYINYITHEISNTVEIPANMQRINAETGIFYKNTKSIIISKDINIGLMRRIN
jgi:ribosomal protein S4